MVMPLSLINASMAYMNLMYGVFKSYLNKSVVQFLDNNLIYSKANSKYTAYLGQCYKP